MKVCYFGTYERNYHRNSAFIEGLRQNGIKVTECYECLWEKIKHKTIKKLFLAIPRAFLAYAKLFFRALFMKKNFDYVIVGYPPSIDIFLAKLLFRKKIIFNPLVSLYDTLVEDRGYIKGAKIKIIKMIDKLSYKMSDLVLIDTKAHADYLENKYPCLKNKIKVIYLGIDSNIIYPEKAKKEKNKFLVHFHGNFIPLHGINKIIRAAKLLENKKDIRFLIIGAGQVEPEINRMIKELNIKNIDRMRWADYEKLKNYLARADVCLGIFGDSEKARIVIPTKVYEYLACKKAIITMKSPASEELFKNRENAILTSNNPEDIAKAILLLKKNKKLKSKIEKNSYKLFLDNFTFKKIGEKINQAISNSL